jgi:hypothetical protein
MSATVHARRVSAPKSRQGLAKETVTPGLDRPPDTVTDTRRTTMEKVFECERDRAVIRGEDDDELVANVDEHIAVAHPDLVGKVSREQIVANAKEADSQ